MLKTQTFLSSVAAFISVLLFSSLVFSSEYSISSELLSKETLARFEKVPEFEFIIQEANKLGVKVYLFGGTASAFAHYVRWDLEREAGDDKYQKERFDYDFTNIYRGNQDLDIVVDGTPEQADQLKVILKEAYPHFVGDRDAWEVRLLRESRGDKRALIGDEDFKKQHSDTNSTGMLLLNPGSQGIVYNDLLNWGSAESDFLNDVAAARIKFLFGEEHEETQRFKDGRNPPVLAAIRYLAKLAQYEVTGTATDLEIVTQIIAETDFTKLKPYGKKKAEEFALKTLLNAPDSEYAWNLLEKTGARQKLIEMDENRLHEKNTLSWWMNKEPLRSKDFDLEGKTAREIFDTDGIIVSHETNSFEAYDNITRSSKGAANAFISRKGVEGETAALGDGFYTRFGLEGARGTGLTIRFKLHPDAREGVDFDKTGDFIVVKNKKALTLIQENINLSIIDFLKLLALNEIGENDKGIKEKFIRKFKRVSKKSPEFLESIQFVQDSFFVSKNFPVSLQFNIDNIPENELDLQKLIDLYTVERHRFFNSTVARNLSSFPLSEFENPTTASFVTQTGQVLAFFIDDVFPKLEQDLQRKWLDYLISEDELYINQILVMHLFSNAKNQNHEEFLDRIFNTESISKQELVRRILSKRIWAHRDDWLFKLFDSDVYDDFISLVFREVFSKSYWIYKIEYLEKIVNYVEQSAPFSIKKEIRNTLFLHVFSNRELYEKEPKLALMLINSCSKENSGSLCPIILREVLAKKFWSNHVDLLEEKLKNSSKEETLMLIEFSLTQTYWKNKGEVIDMLLERNNIEIDFALLNFVISHHHHLNENKWKALEYKRWIRVILSRKNESMKTLLAGSEAGKKYWKGRNTFIKRSLAEGYDELVIEKIAPYTEFEDEEKVFMDLFNRDEAPIDYTFIRYFFSQPRSVKFKKLLELLLNRYFKDGYDIYSRHIIEFVLSKKHWKEVATVWVDKYLRQNVQDLNKQLIMDVLSQDYFEDDDLERWVEVLMESDDKLTHEYLIRKVKFRSTWKKSKEWIQKLMSIYYIEDHFGLYVDIAEQFTEPFWATQYPELITRLLELNYSDLRAHIIKNAFSHSGWRERPEVIEEVVKYAGDSASKAIAQSIFSQDYWLSHPRLLAKFLIKHVKISTGRDVVFINDKLSAVLTKLLDGKELTVYLFHMKLKEDSDLEGFLRREMPNYLDSYMCKGVLN